MSDDLIFREVESDLRNEQLKSLWSRFGIFIIGVAVLIVVGVSGYKGWTWYQAKQVGEAGDQYISALEAIRQDKDAEGLRLLEEIEKAGINDYPVMAQLAAAGTRQKMGEVAEAIAEFDAVAGTAKDKDIATIASLRAAALLVDSSDQNAVEQRIGHLNEQSSPWRHVARELLGLAAHHAGDYQKAEEFFRSIVSDPEVPPGVRQRAEILLTVIAPKLSEGATQ